MPPLVEELHALLARPMPVLGLALSRITLGAVLAYDVSRMLREHDAWYATDGLRPRRSALPSMLDAFAWFEQLGGSSRTLLRVALGAAVAFACGLATPVAGVILLVCLIAVIARNPYVAYGADAFACAVLLLLLGSPSGDALSVDRLLEDGSLGLHTEASPWGGQLLRFEVAALYLGNFVLKLRSPAWRSGVVMFDLLHNPNFARAGVPAWLARREVARWLTWGALAAELAFGPALLFQPTAAIACVAAITFHAAIARLVDVHLFSAVMIAALIACWPMGSGGSPPPPLDAQRTIALSFALGYLAWAVFSDLSTTSRGRRAGPSGRLGTARGWRMFIESTPSVVDVEITMLDADGGLAQWSWAHLDDLWDPRPTHRGHRFQRFQFALLRDGDARRRLAARLRAELARSGREARAWSIDVIVRGVHSGAVVHGLNVGAQIATTATGAVDGATCRALADAVHCPSTATELRSLAVIGGAVDPGGLG